MARTRKARSRIKGKGKGKGKGRPDRRRPQAGGRSSLMERLEERWRRRQEGDRQM